MGDNMIVSLDKLALRVVELERRLDDLTEKREPPEPPPDLEETIRSVRESNEGLRNLLADAKQTERDLDTEVARLTKENQRLTQLAWQAEQDKRSVEVALKAAVEELKSACAGVEQARLERDDLARRLEFECEELFAMRAERDELSLRLADERRQREALIQRALELRRGLLSVLGVTEKEGSSVL